jgi:hypothetical protein
LGIRGRILKISWSHHRPTDAELTRDTISGDVIPIIVNKPRGN